MATNQRPCKPYPDVPLFAHASGQWQRKSGGKTHYFGTWDEPYEALERYLEKRDYLRIGRTPPRNKGVTLNEMVNRYLTEREADWHAGDLSGSSYHDYKRDGKRLLDILGRHEVIGNPQPLD